MSGLGRAFAVLALCIAFTPPSALAEDTWSLQPTPSAGGASDPNRLYTVDCAPDGVSACTAVGTRTSAGVDSPVAQRWNGASWTEQAAAKKSGATHTRLFGVDCPSETRCLAVGNHQSAEGASVLSEIWNEGKWNVQTTPLPSESTSSEFVAIDCNSTANCTAVGSAVIGGVKKAIAERWTSPNWAQSSIPIPEGATSSQLDGVDCIWSNVCVAVGRYTTSKGSIKSLALVWDGTNWSLQTLTDPEKAVQSTLLDASCTKSPTRCTVVGGWKNSAGEQFTLAYRYNGSTWTLQSTPNPSGSIASVLQEVSCETETSCTAVGSWVNGGGGSNQTLAEAWNGTNWAIQTTPNPTGNTFSAFFGVACRTQSMACIAVGYSTQSGVHKALGQLRTQWAVKTTPNTPEYRWNWLGEVNCEPNSIKLCMAVGGSRGVSEQEDTQLITKWNGTEWSSETPAMPPGAEAHDPHLEGSQCASTTSCIAVGWFMDGSDQKPFSQTWNGSSWAAHVPENPSSGSLSKVGCSAATACTAVGSYSKVINEEEEIAVQVPLIERWNGTNWSLQGVSLPEGALSGEFQGIQCKTSTFCIAVGRYFDVVTERHKALSATWNGSSWSLQTVAAPAGALEYELVDVGCTATTECTAVGTYDVGWGESRPLVERWNGASWAVEGVPVPMGTSASDDYGLFNVSCASSTSCMAVGTYTVGNALESHDHSFAVAWGGSNWSYQLTPLPLSVTESALAGVSCRGGKCVAVGTNPFGEEEFRTLGLIYNSE